MKTYQDIHKTDIEYHKDNPIIKTLMDGFKSDVDNNWNLYHGNRETRLKDLAEIIDMLS